MKLPMEAMGCDVVCGADALVTDDVSTANTDIFYLYRQTNAYEVVILLVEKNSGQEIPWTISRDVLIECALNGNTAGGGDFAIEVNTKYPLEMLHNKQPAPDSLMIHLSGQDPNQNDPEVFSHAHVFVLREPMQKFLRQTLLVVPAGTEGAHYDIDELIRELTDADA